MDSALVTTIVGALATAIAALIPEVVKLLKNRTTKPDPAKLRNAVKHLSAATQSLLSLRPDLDLVQRALRAARSAGVDAIELDRVEALLAKVVASAQPAQAKAAASSRAPGKPASRAAHAKGSGTVRRAVGKSVAAKPRKR